MRGSIILSLIAGLSLSVSALAAPQTITGSVSHVSLLELYTSEGCSTCPPAEQWVSRLQQDRRLWAALVPVTFHVDYWDSLGWKDPFDSHVYTERQQEIAGEAHSLAGMVIYTPQFVLDGHDWRGWLNDKPLQVDDSAKPGSLVVSTDGLKVTARFSPTQPRSEALQVHVVLLAFGVDVPVGAGENKGATLRHDFLVIADADGALRKDKDGYHGAVTLPPPVAAKATRYALAAWVSAAGSPLPIQATGGWLEASP